MTEFSCFSRITGPYIFYLWLNLIVRRSFGNNCIAANEVIFSTANIIIQYLSEQIGFKRDFLFMI